MSYLHMARKNMCATFQYHNIHQKPPKDPVPPKILSLQEQCEVIYENMSLVTLEEFQRDGLVLEKLVLMDILTISCVKIYNDEMSIELFFDTSKRPYLLKAREEDFSDLYLLSQDKASIEISWNTGSAVVVPGMLFKDSPTESSLSDSLRESF